MVEVKYFKNIVFTINKQTPITPTPPLRRGVVKYHLFLIFPTFPEIPNNYPCTAK